MRSGFLLNNVSKFVAVPAVGWSMAKDRGLHFLILFAEPLNNS
jgi:hypothetical protein